MSSAVSRLNATVVGEGDHTVVLANGFGTNQHSWRHQAAALAGRCRVVRFDSAGTPDADLASWSAERYATLHGHADDVVELLDELDVAGVTFVGHSVSGMVGCLASVAAPDRVARLVLLSASPRYIDDPAAGYVGGFSREAVDGVLAAATADLHAWAGGFSPLVVGRADCPEVVEEFASYLRQMRPDVASRTLTTVFTSDNRALLPRVTAPVLVVQPRDDVAVPAAVGRYLAARLPNATLCELRARGHLPHVTSPDEVTAVLAAYLDAAAIAA